MVTCPQTLTHSLGLNRMPVDSGLAPTHVWHPLQSLTRLQEMTKVCRIQVSCPSQRHKVSVRQSSGSKASAACDYVIDKAHDDKYHTAHQRYRGMIGYAAHSAAVTVMALHAQGWRAGWRPEGAMARVTWPRGGERRDEW